GHRWRTARLGRVQGVAWRVRGRSQQLRESARSVRSCSPRRAWRVRGRPVERRIGGWRLGQRRRNVGGAAVGRCHAALGPKQARELSGGLGWRRARGGGGGGGAPLRSPDILRGGGRGLLPANQRLPRLGRGLR